MTNSLFTRYMLIDCFILKLKIMKISELIKELEHQKELHGDIEVEVFASTDCGYSGGGGCIEDITFNTRTIYQSKYVDGNYIPDNIIYDCITLENHEG